MLSSDDRRALVDLVEAVRKLPYGRPSDRTVGAMLREGRGTCSTKHLFLARALAERFPETNPQIIHRVYTLDAETASRLFGDAGPPRYRRTDSRTFTATSRFNWTEIGSR